MRPLKLTILVLLFLSFLMSAFFVWLGVSLLRLPRSRILSELMKSFTGVIRILLNVKVTVEGAGDWLGTGGHFIASNHLGYLDGVVLESLFPMILVTKRRVTRCHESAQSMALL